MTGSATEVGPSVAPATGGLAVPAEDLASSLDLPHRVDGYLASSPTYGPLQAGDKCRVVRGFWADKLKGCRLEFVRYEVNVRTGKSWLVFWGGKAGYAGWQYLSPDDVKKI